MLAAPSRDWNVFQQIFADHWEPFQRAHPRYQTPYYEGLVAKMLACGNPAKMGYVEYRCLYSIIAAASSPTHNLDPVRKGHAWRLLWLPTNPAIRAARYPRV